MRRGLALLALALLGCSGGDGLREPHRRFRIVRATVAFEMIKDNPELFILDVRPRDEYFSAAGHLARARSTPLATLDESWARLQLSREDTVLVYSGDGGDDQRNAAEYLIGRGQRFVVQIERGLEGWLDAGFAVVVEAPLSPSRPLGR